VPKTDTQTEKTFLAAYDRRNFDAPLTTVDMAIFSLIDGNVQVLLIRRAQHPALGQWALPGGFIDLEQDQQLADAARRKLEEKTGVTTAYLDQVETFGSADRDPRGWSVTILYYALIDATGVELQAHESAAEARWVPVEEAQLLDLAFDHQQLLAAAQQRLKAQVEYTTLPVHLMPEEFTLSELQKVFEAILEKSLEKKSFRRRIQDADILEETANMRRAGSRPAQLYRIQDSECEYFFSRTLQGKRG
jgi:8-oxo-dGTP diphosphatase